MPNVEADVAADLKVQVAALKKLGKAVTGDLSRVMQYGGDLEDAAKKLAAQRQKIEGDGKGKDPSEVKKFNDALVELKKSATTIAKLCQPYRTQKVAGADIASKIWKDANLIQGLGSIE